MKVKTADLIGPALVWAVARIVCDEGWLARHLHLLQSMAFSTDWAQGGPIIENEKVCLSWMNNFGAWHAQLGDEAEFNAYGPTPLIAAMRCFVASRLGDEIDAPDELV